MHYFYILIPLCTKTIVARIDLDENINFREIDCFHLFYDDRTWRGDQSSELISQLIISSKLSIAGKIHASHLPSLKAFI